MEWIKKRYDQFALVLLAVALLAVAVLVILKTRSFGEKFSEAQVAVPPINTVPDLKLDNVDNAKTALEQPPAWTVSVTKDAKRGSLFVSDLYIIDTNTGVPISPRQGALRSDSLTKQPIPNGWFIGHNLSPLQADAASQDPDKDGFLNEDEWRGSSANPGEQSTDPNNKDSHPPYHTKLFVKAFIQVPFRIVFKAYDGDPKKVAPEKMEFQLDTLDRRQPSMFKKLGEMIDNTKFKLEKFEYKEAPNPNTGENDDVSELTVINTESGQPVVLVHTKVTNSPDVYQLFDYQWPQPAQEIRVRTLQEFRLKPEVDKPYKLIDAQPDTAVIQLPTGEKHTVPRDPRKPR